MAGHSKWANIQHRKGRQDKARSKLFSKLSKEITVAAKMGTPDPDMNPRLRLAVQNAKANSMPKDNIERAINKGSGADAENYEEIRYEGFGQEGVGIIVEVMTDNKNRSASEVRSTFSKNGGNLGETGGVSFGFDRVGEIRYAGEVADEEAMLEAALEAGAEDVESGEDGHTVYTALEDLADVAATLESRFGEPTGTGVIWKPQNLIPVQGETAHKVLKLVGALDDLDDVQNVYANFDISDEDLASFEG